MPNYYSWVSEMTMFPFLQGSVIYSITLNLRYAICQNKICKCSAKSCYLWFILYVWGKHVERIKNMGKNYHFNTFDLSTKRQQKVFSLSKSTLIYVKSSLKIILSHCCHESYSWSVLERPGLVYQRNLQVYFVLQGQLPLPLFIPLKYFLTILIQVKSFI